LVFTYTYRTSAYMPTNPKLPENYFRVQKILF
jgi:hypothetical protein